MFTEWFNVARFFLTIYIYTSIDPLSVIVQIIELRKHKEMESPVPRLSERKLLFTQLIVDHLINLYFSLLSAVLLLVCRNFNSFCYSFL